MKTPAPTVKTVQVNGKEVLDFTPQSTSQLAIVPLSVIQKLASLLDTQSLYGIKQEMAIVLNNSEINTIEQYVKVLQEEIDFHNTVNLLTSYEPQREEEKEKEYVS